MLLSVDAVQFSFDHPFKWSSGWNSPIYCDSRLTLSYPEIRTFIKESFVELAQKYYAHTEAVAGVATAGIPQGALLAESLNLPFLYVRAKPKGHGKENLIEGKVIAGQKVLLVEDIVSTGRSVIEAAQALRARELEVVGVLAIFTYGFDFAMQNFKEEQLPLYCLSDYTHLLVEVFKKEGVSEKTMASLHEWRKQPDTWAP